ncbi:MAG: methyltransferase [Desulfobacteraceae bacterium]|nr:MAG: methyltransferase [Desulfobacteraceae bacterium]
MNELILNLLIKQTLPDARMRITALPLCPELKLYLLDPRGMDRPFSQEETRIILAQTPFWAFCWASGQATGQYLLQHAELVRGKRVLDFGAGSGVAGIAAALAGAQAVWACDLDEQALEAVRANADLNRVTIRTCQALEQAPGRFDLLLAADVLYDRENLPWLERFLAIATRVLVAESRLKIRDVPPYEKIAEVRASTLPILSGFDVDQVVEFYEDRRARGWEEETGKGRNGESAK